MSTETYPHRTPEPTHVAHPATGPGFSRHDLVASLVERAGCSPPWAVRPEAADALRSWSTVDLCREWQALGSARPGFERQKLHSPDAIRAAVSTGDLSSFYDSAFGSTIQAGFAAERDSTLGWTTSVDVPNFKSIESYILASFGTLRRLPRGQKAEHVDFSLSAESWSVARYAAKFTIDEQDLLDDRALQMHLLAAKQLGSAARRLTPDLVFSKLLQNPVLSADGVALFDASHSNYGTGVLSEANLETAISAIAGQTFTTRDGRAIHPNAWPVALIVPPALAGEARKLVRAIILNDGQDIKVVSESRLSATGVVDPATGTKRVGTDTNWLLVGGPTAFPSVVVGYIDGASPKVRSSELKGEHGQFGREWGVHLDLGCGIVDYRNLYFSTGAV